MRTITATEASRGFSELLDAVERGETVRITRGNRTIAQVGPAVGVSGRSLREALAALPPLDGDVESDIASAMALLTEGVDPWDGA